MLELLAQVPTPTDISSGWYGAGILGLVVLTLLKYVYDKDQIIKDLVQANKNDIKELVAENSAAVKELAEKSDKRQDAMMSTFNLHTREIREANEAVNDRMAQDYKDKLGMILTHCKDESEARSQENKATNERISKDMEMMVESNRTLREAISQLANSVPARGK